MGVVVVSIFEIVLSLSYLFLDLVNCFVHRHHLVRLHDLVLLLLVVCVRVVYLILHALQVLDLLTLSGVEVEDA